MKKLFILFIVVLATAALWASNVITYTATSKLPEVYDYGSNIEGLHLFAFNVVISNHTFYEGQGTITFAGEVTSIGSQAFYQCNSLTSISIPQSVTNIENNAFFLCTSLPVVNNIRYADTYLVEVTNNTLSTYTIKQGTKWIGNGAFYCCYSLKSINIPNSVTSIGSQAFYGCYSLKSINIPNSVTSIGHAAFYGTSLPDVNNMQYAGNYLVSAYDKFLSTYTIKQGTKWIGDYAFQEYDSLKSINIPNSVTSIGDGAFYWCFFLKSITIPNSVTRIGAYAFRNCASLPVVNKIRYADTYLVEPIDISLSTYTIKPGTKWIGYEAFHICDSLKYITIPNSVTSIEDGAFAGCNSLSSIILSNRLTHIGKYAFSSCNFDSIFIPNSVTNIEDGAFYNCQSLKSINIPNSLTHIGKYAFNYCNFNSIFIPNSVTNIEDGAFFYCQSLKSINIPNSVTSIGHEVFYNCTSLTSIAIPDSVTSIGYEAFFNCHSLKSITCYAKVPPICTGWSFEFVDKSIPLYVPDESINDYKAAKEWKDFTNIQAITTDTAIKSEKDNSKNNDNHKVMKDGQLLILRDGKTYNAQGAVVE